MPNPQHHTRILHAIESASLGGAEALALALALGMEERGYEPVFAVSRGGWLAERVSALGRETILLPERAAVDLGFVRWLTGLLRERRIALVHAHMMGMNLYGSVAARRAAIPSISVLHGELYDLERGRRRLMYRLIGHLTSRLVAVSEDLGAALRDAGVSKQRVTVIPNGVTLPRLPAERDRPMGARLVSVGSLTEVKGHRYLLQALGRLRAAWPEVRLTVIGEGPCRRDLEALRDELDLADCAEFPGRRDAVVESLLDSDIFVLPSVSEGQSLALLEAMAAALPVVATRVGGNEEIVVNGVTGILVSAESPEALAEAIGSLLADPGRAIEMGQAARRRVEEQFSLETTLTAYDALYRELLPAGPDEARR